MITVKRATAIVGESTCTIEFYLQDNRVMISVNGAITQFNSYKGPVHSHETAMENTIQAIKEAAAEL